MVSFIFSQNDQNDNSNNNIFIIDKSGDGFLSCADIISYCEGSNSTTNQKQLTKSEIKNVVWLMDDHM